MKSNSSSLIEPSDKAGLIRKMAAALVDTGDPELRWAARGCLLYLQREGPDLGACLGLKPRQGGRYETPWVLSRQSDRDDKIRELAQMLPGKVMAKATTLADWFAAENPPAEVGDDVAEKYRELRRASPPVPRSARQIARILKGETIAARRA